VRRAGPASIRTPIRAIVAPPAWSAVAASVARPGAARAASAANHQTVPSAAISAAVRSIRVVAANAAPASATASVAASETNCPVEQHAAKAPVATATAADQTKSVAMACAVPPGMTARTTSASRSAHQENFPVTANAALGVDSAIDAPMASMSAASVRASTDCGVPDGDIC
jgi:hypothetical protein